MNKFYLVITKVLREPQDFCDRKVENVHKVIILSFPPFKDLRIEDETGEWEVIIEKMFQLSYISSSKNKNAIFHYTDRMECSSSEEKQELLNRYLEYGWSRGEGYSFKV